MKTNRKKITYSDLVALKKKLDAQAYHPKIYIAGKISGEKRHDITMKFGAAQKKLEAQGYEVVNPLAVVNDWHCDWHTAMRKCIAALMQCDAIFLLKDFSQSKGAWLEYELAMRLHIEIIKEPKKSSKDNVHTIS